MASTQHPHFVLFPFMSKGHTIPLLNLAQILLRRRVTLTLITTNANQTFIAQFLQGQIDSINFIVLPFPKDVEGIPQGIESIDNLPSITLFWKFVAATKLMQPYFEQVLKNLSHVTCIISDVFLSWTYESAKKLGIPRFSFHGMSCYASALSEEIGANQLLSGPESDDELITVPRFPWTKYTKKDLDGPFSQKVRTIPYVDKDFILASINSYGQIMNNFYELEPLFLDYLNNESKMPKSWCVGPFCLGESPTSADHGSNHEQKPKWIEWLDRKLDQGCSVLYVAFGSQSEISTEQMKAIVDGLEQSEVNFLLVVRSVVGNLQERLGERGMIVREWVDQREILNHESVKGFVSHCGWNSVIESICSEVPILAWPMMSDQPMNAKMVVEEIKIGLKVETCDGSLGGFVKSEELKKMVKELMEGEKGKEVMMKVKEFGKAAKVAMAEDGSSWRTLNQLIEEVQKIRKN